MDSSEAPEHNTCPTEASAAIDSLTHEPSRSDPVEDLDPQIKSLHVSCPKCGSNAQVVLAAEEKADNTIALPSLKSTEAETRKSSDAKEEAKDPLQQSGDEKKTQESLTSRTRIGRHIKGKDGKTKVVDEAEWEAPPDFAKDGTFAITLERKTIGQTPWGVPIEGKEHATLVSPALQKLFRSVVKYFPGIGLDGSHITFTDPYAPLFFYFDELRKAAERHSDGIYNKDLDCLVQFYTKWVLPEHENVRKMIEQGIVQYSDLWALFRPGDIVYSLDEPGEPCLYMLIATDYRKAQPITSDDSFSSKRFHRLCADMWSVVWDSATNTFQRFTTTHSIRSFSGGCSITSLPFYPLKYYKSGSVQEIEKLCRFLENRGRHWKRLVSEPPSCRFYRGAGRNQGTSEVQHLNERVVVDGAAISLKPMRERSGYGTMGGVSHFQRVEYEFHVVSAGINDEYTQFDDFDRNQEFSPLQAQLCASSVSCYAMKSQTRFNISVSKVEEVQWAKEALDHLVLEESVKSMLLGLVQQHRKNKDQVLSDVIPSKGKGLVIVLHGPPGVGKTLTAETIAEYTQKPLYPINIGELTAEQQVVGRLQDIFKKAARWDAVLLLDEADVLLEKRSYEDLRRNGIVSVFLRMLEYYEGILFLTTNRVETMDIAFQSRIQIAIKYKPLTSAVRRCIWENFIKRLDDREAEGKQELLEALNDMQEWELNGRQIRNILAIAESLALSKGRRRGALRYSHVEDVANETINFQNFFEDASKERKGQVGEINSRQFQERSRNFR